MQIPSLRAETLLSHISCSYSGRYSYHRDFPQIWFAYEVSDWVCILCLANSHSHQFTLICKLDITVLVHNKTEVLGHLPHTVTHCKSGLNLCPVDPPKPQPQTHHKSNQILLCSIFPSQRASHCNSIQPAQNSEKNPTVATQWLNTRWNTSSECPTPRLGYTELVSSSPHD